MIHTNFSYQGVRFGGSLNRGVEVASDTEDVVFGRGVCTSVPVPVDRSSHDFKHFEV